MQNNRSVAKANGELITQLRKELLWTQADLAQHTGYSERLIVKAEASGSLASTTLENICEAFCEHGLEASFADITLDAKSLVRKFVEGMYHHRGEVIANTRHFLHPEATFHFNGDPSVFPFAGTHVGMQEVDHAFKSFFSILEPPEDLSELEKWEYLSTGRGALAWGDSWIHPIGQPMETPVKVAVRCDFLDGLLRVFDDRFDTQAGAAVLDQ